MKKNVPCPCEGLNEHCVRCDGRGIQRLSVRKPSKRTAPPPSSEPAAPVSRSERRRQQERAEKPFECKLCGERFTSEIRRVVHLAQQHEVVSKERALELKAGVVERPEPKKGVYVEKTPLPKRAASSGASPTGEESRKPLRVLSESEWKHREGLQKRQIHVPVETARVFRDVLLKLEAPGLADEVDSPSPPIHGSPKKPSYLVVMPDGKEVSFKRFGRLCKFILFISKKQNKNFIITDELKENILSNDKTIIKQLNLVVKTIDREEILPFWNNVEQDTESAIRSLLVASKDDFVQCPFCGTRPPKHMLLKHWTDFHPGLDRLFLSLWRKHVRGHPRTPTVPRARSARAEADGTYGLHTRRENGRFGSHPSYDDFDN